MKVKCSGCNASYNLDTSKIPIVPEKAYTITCPKCKNKIPLQLKAPINETENSEQQQTVIIPCSDCGHVNIAPKKCAGCGKVFTEDELEILKINVGG